jgi:aspartyl-tRNA(Asn)/glutamyl-tRNA(Gln) amidotransferase subunit C
MTNSGLNEQTVKKLAALARLALDDNEVRALVPELQSIVRHIDSMRSVDTAGIAPMTHGHPDGAVLHNATSPADDDDVAVLGTAAVSDSAGFDPVDGTVRVPKVID